MHRFSAGAGSLWSCTIAGHARETRARLIIIIARFGGCGMASPIISWLAMEHPLVMVKSKSAIAGDGRLTVVTCTAITWTISRLVFVSWAISIVISRLALNSTPARNWSAICRSGVGRATDVRSLCARTGRWILRAGLRIVQAMHFRTTGLADSGSGITQSVAG